VPTVCEHTMNKDGGILINVSRGIIYAGTAKDFAEKANNEARKCQEQMKVYL